MILGAFANSTQAMIAQSVALGTISQNIANVNTTGYKKTETDFKTKLSETKPGLNIFTVAPDNRTLVDRQGQILTSNTWSDMAINGDGLFVLNSKPDGSGQTMYGRDGKFKEQELNGQAYMTDTNGNYLMGWKADPNGTVSPGTSLAGLTGVSYQLGAAMPGQVTTNEKIQGNLDAAAGTDQVMYIPVYDPTATAQNVSMAFTPTSPNNWTLNFGISPTNSGPIVTSAPVAVTFDGDGQLVSPAGGTTNLTVNWGGTTGSSTVAVDLSKLTQYGGITQLDHAIQDGHPGGVLTGVNFDNKGVLTADFSNGATRQLSQLPLAKFVSPNNLDERSGNVYLASEASGPVSITPVTGSSEADSFVSSSLEQSNVDIGDEFTRMIVTQKAYSAATNVFKTADEMTQSCRDLLK